MRPAPRRFLSVCVALDAPRIKSKSQEVESIVSHPLKFAEGGAASVGLMEGWASPPTLCGFQRVGATYLSVGTDDSPVVTRDIGTQEVYAISVKWP